jgi:hypothetical protein
VAIEPDSPDQSRRFSKQMAVTCAYRGPCVALAWPLRGPYGWGSGPNRFASGESWLSSMRFGKNGDDPTARRRRAPDEVLLQAQEVIARQLQGESVRSIARALGLARTSVARIVAEYEAAQEALDSGEDLNSEHAALVAKYSDGGMKADDVRTVEDVRSLNALEYYRLGHLPGADHPGRVAWAEARATGYRRPVA